MATLAGHAEIYDGFLKTAERLGLVGTEAVKFANDQADREERRVERERTREESERQRQHEIEMERMRLERASVESSRASESHREAVASSKPKLPPFVDGKDDLDSYLNRFERMARSKGWEQNEWAINLSALLTGRALEVYSRLDEQESQDYEKLRDALLRRYGLTGEGYRRKLRESRPDPDESPGQFITRLSGYLLRWVDLASIDRSFQELKDLLVYEQFMEVCPKQLELYLRERVGHDLEDLAEHATKYLEAHGKSFHSLFKRHLQDNKEKGMESSSLEMAGSATTLRAEVDQRDQCMFCKYPHPSNECRKVKNLTLAERREALMRSAACFWCLRPGHRASVCRANQPRCRNCGNRHSWLLCENGVTESGLQSSPAATDATVTAASTSIEKPSQEILMQTARVKAQGEGGGALIRIMLDSGSNQTFIRSDLAKKLGCKELGNQPLNVQTFGGAHAANQPSRKVQVSLFPSDGRESRGLTLAAYEVPNICAPPPYLSQEKVKQFPHLRGLRLADSPVAGHGAAGQIDVLIGLDYLQDVVDGRMRKGTDGPIALGSRFGWILGGRSGTDVEYAGVKMTNFIRADALQELENLWTLEGIGISSEGASTSGLKEEMARAADEHFDATCQRLPDGRYENRWPWKRDPLDLPRNEDQALRRLEACERSLRRNGKLAQYDDAIQEYLDLGHAEKAPRDPNGPVHYLPHQAVYKKEKVRVVFDAAAGQPNSLNDFILPEPNLIADLSGVLLRFRLREIGVTADVEKAFLQLALHPEDRDVTRFLWRAHASDQCPTAFRMTRVVFGVTASPFLLQATIKKHLQQYEDSDPDLVAVLRRDIYCDDLITSVHSADEGEQLKKRSMEIFSQARMNLRHWSTSRSETRPDRPDHLKLLGEHDDKTQRVLGVSWIPASDNLIFMTEPLASLGAQFAETKRNILKITARFFDPLGLLAPFSVRARMMLKELWKNKVGWDQPIPRSLGNKWAKWLHELRHIDRLAIPRSYGLSTELRYQLHVFCDASQHAYAAVVYTRAENVDGDQKTTVVMCKSRLSPSQDLSLPRLELTSCLIGARLAAYVKGQLMVPPTSEHYWSDSMVSLSWIHSDAERWGVFVKNRVKEIQTLTSRIAWNHCSGSENPADLPSRGSSASHLTSDLWLHGPPWLRSDPAEWPQTPEWSDIAEPSECTTEAKKLAMPAHAGGSPSAGSMNTGLSKLIDAARFSSLDRLLRVTAWVLRWIRTAQTGARRAGPLTSSEIGAAERRWVEDAQLSAFAREIATLTAGGSVEKSSQIYVLNPSLEDGLLRKTGRLQQSALDNDEKHPIILPSEHPLVDLLIQRTHQQLCHAGVQQVLNHVRGRYWVVRGRQRVRACLRACPKCTIFRTQHFDQNPAPLPRDRVSVARPFSRSGVDIGGPLLVKRPGSGEAFKAYFVVFTCAVVRGVHLELVSSLTTDDFMKAYRRFVARRGQAISVRSDNARTFRGAASILANEGVTWLFSCERAPWWGGFWERVVGMTKSALRRTLGRSLLTWEELETVLCSIEAAINARPLTVVTDDPDDVRPLRPSDFLHCPVPDEAEVAENEAERLQRRRRYQHTLLTHLWARWHKEYLRNLRDFHGSATTESPKPGDLVLVEGERSSNRLSWVTGLISALHQGRDGLVRSATVRTNQGEMRRPVQKLYLLEASKTEE